MTTNNNAHPVYDQVIKDLGFSLESIKQDRVVSMTRPVQKVTVTK